MRAGDTGAMGDAGPAGSDGTAGRQDAGGPAPARLPRAQPVAARARAARQWQGRPGWPAALESELGPRFAAQGSWPRYQGDDDLLEMWQHLLGPDGAAQAAAISRERAARQQCGQAVQPPQSGQFGPGHGGSSGNGTPPAAGRLAPPRHRRWYGRPPRPGPERTQRAGRWHWWLLAIAVVLAAFSAVAPGLGHARPVRRHAQSPVTVPPAAVSAAAIRSLAARWITEQVSPGAIVACDPAMAATLEATGLPAGDTLVLRQGSLDPLGSDVVVATTAVRDQFGSRLSEVYAPDVMASFGAGNARIEIRAVAPDGSAAYRSVLSADLSARKAAGAQLLLNSRINVAAIARRQLAGGEPDSRILITLAALAAVHPLYIAAFGDSGQGASPSMPLRSVTLAAGSPAAGGPASSDPAAAGPAAAGGGGLGGAGNLPRMLAFLRAQRPPYLPGRVQIARPAGEQPTLRIEFAAPSPLGLLGTQDFVIKVMRPHDTS